MPLVEENTSPALIKPITWQQAMRKIEEKIFKIKTPRGHGTGFHLGNFGKRNSLCAVATALHVVDDEHDWDGAIKLEHHLSGRTMLFKAGQRTIFPYPKSDLAIIVFTRPSDFEIPDISFERLDPTKALRPGVEVGWCGFPGLMSEKLCFFHGYISCYINQDQGYLVDGVAINGVSGGPVIYLNKNTNEPILVGAITAYVANRATRDTLPGVSMIADISPFEETIKFLKTLSEVKVEAEKQQEEQKGAAEDDKTKGS